MPPSGPRPTFIGMRSPRRIGDSLRAARQQADATQEATAAAAGVSREALNLLENGRRWGRIETLKDVLDVLGYEIAFVPRTDEEQRLRDPGLRARE